MLSKKNILLIVIGLVIAGLLFYIIYIKKTFNNFSDLGALIQLQTSRPVKYINFYPDNLNVYDNVVLSYAMSSNDIPTNTNMKKVIHSKKGNMQNYPIPYPMAYTEDYPIEHPMFIPQLDEYPIIRPYEEKQGPPFPMIDRI